MKTRNRILAVGLASLIPLTALAACGGSQGGATSARSKAESVTIPAMSGAELIQKMADGTRSIFCPEMAQVGEAAEHAAFVENFRRTNPTEKKLTAEEAWELYIKAVDC